MSSAVPNSAIGRLPPRLGSSSGSSPRPARAPRTTAAVYGVSGRVRDGSMIAPVVNSTAGSNRSTCRLMAPMTSLARCPPTSRMSHFATATFGMMVRCSPASSQVSEFMVKVGRVRR